MFLSSVEMTTLSSNFADVLTLTVFRYICTLNTVGVETVLEVCFVLY